MYQSKIANSYDPQNTIWRAALDSELPASSARPSCQLLRPCTEPCAKACAVAAAASRLPSARPPPPRRRPPRPPPRAGKVVAQKRWVHTPSGLVITHKSYAGSVAQVSLCVKVGGAGAAAQQLEGGLRALQGRARGSRQAQHRIAREHWQSRPTASQHADNGEPHIPSLFPLPSLEQYKTGVETAESCKAKPPIDADCNGLAGTVGKTKDPACAKFIKKRTGRKKV